MGKDRDDLDVYGVWHTAQVDDVAHLQESHRHQTSLIPDDFENAPKNWTVPAIFSAIFFLPTGIVAVSNARKAHRSLEQGDHGLWRYYTGRTRFFVFLSLLLGIVMYATLSVVINFAKKS